MNCPVCKYPNPQGASHCGMCYEVFNRSAAHAYLRVMQRERHETEKEHAPKSVVTVPAWKEKASEVFEKIDWGALSKKLTAFLWRSKGWVMTIAGLALGWMVVNSLLDPGLWYHLFGRKITYAFSDNSPAPYMVGLSQDIHCWSERQGRLDTPMEKYRVEDLGNVLLEKRKTGLKNRFVAALRPREWIEIIHDAQGSASHSIPLKHPSLAEGRAIFTKKGTLIERRGKLSPRLTKALLFLTPTFPPGTLRRGRSWTEPVEWMDVYSDWKIDWAGTLRETLGELEPCGRSTCARMTYQAELHPRLWEAPAWARKSTRAARGQISTEGTALFDVNRHVLVSNTFSYEGLVYVPIRDLGLIPWELRIGRRVKEVPGDIVIHLQNKIDVRIE